MLTVVHDAEEANGGEAGRSLLDEMGLLHDQVTVSVTRPDWPVWS